MQTRGRPRSLNIDDRRAYFGTESVDPDYATDDRNADFLSQSIMSPYLSAPPQQFKNAAHLTIEDLLALIAQEKARKAPKTGTSFSAGKL